MHRQLTVGMLDPAHLKSLHKPARVDAVRRAAAAHHETRGSHLHRRGLRRPVRARPLPLQPSTQQASQGRSACTACSRAGVWGRGVLWTQYPHHASIKQQVQTPRGTSRANCRPLVSRQRPWSPSIHSMQWRWQGGTTWAGRRLCLWKCQTLRGPPHGAQRRRHGC